MNLNRRSSLPLVLALGWVSVLTGGCISTGGPEWKWQRCYKGPRRHVADVAVVLVPRDPVPLRLRSIDGKRVREAQEYHLLPGSHTLVVQPQGHGFGPPHGLMEWSGERDTIAPMLEPGTVYRLTADTAWGDDSTPQGKDCQRKWFKPSDKPYRPYLPYPQIIGWRHRERGRWSARVEELGSFEALQDQLTRQLDHFRTRLREKSLGLTDVPWPYAMWGFGIQPPEHWLSADPKSTAQR